jgi:hypothetical protein
MVHDSPGVPGSMQAGVIARSGNLSSTRSDRPSACCMYATSLLVLALSLAHGTVLASNRTERQMRRHA